MIIPKTPNSPWDTVAIDVYGPVIESHEGYNNILVMSDVFSGFVILSPLFDPTSEQISRAIVQDLILTFGRLPNVILSDNAQYFNAKLTNQILKLLGIKHKNTTPRAPWTNPCERKNPFLAYFLKFSLLEGQDLKKWPEKLKFIAFSINSSYNRTTGFSPIELLFGTDVSTIDTAKGSGTVVPMTTYQSYVEELKERLQYLHSTAKQNMEAAREKAKLYKDKKINPLNLKIGDLVLLKNQKPILAKTDVPFIGPFSVVELNQNSAKIYKGRSHKWVPMNNLRMYEPPMSYTFYIKLSDQAANAKKKKTTITNKQTNDA